MPESSRERSHAGMPPIFLMPRPTGGVMPDRLYVDVPGVDIRDCRRLSQAALVRARMISPKLSGASASRMATYYGHGYFGVRWQDPYVWFQEAGIRPFTMRSLAGKTIPMWIDDPTGEEARKQGPKAKTRVTASGRKQVLIFRKAGKIGARKTTVKRDRSGRMIVRSVPQSYPGAPGRIAVRSWPEYPEGGHTGKIARLVTRTHIGVRWRHPGLLPRGFIQYSLQSVCMESGLGNLPIKATYRRR